MAILATCADVAQLARASACHAEGRGFESLHPLSRKPRKRGFFHARERARRPAAQTELPKTAQITQFATTAPVFQPPVAFHSMIKTGISASVAPRTTGSNGVRTRPDSSCDHTAVVFVVHTRRTGLRGSRAARPLFLSQAPRMVLTRSCSTRTSPHRPRRPSPPSSATQATATGTPTTTGPTSPRSCFGGSRRTTRSFPARSRSYGDGFLEGLLPGA